MEENYKITIFALLVYCLVPVLANENVKNDCKKAKNCYWLLKNDIHSRNSTPPSTLFCFEGMQKNVLYMWSNPMLRVTRNLSNANETSKFITYYGLSAADVESKSQQPGYSILMGWFSSVRALQQNEDMAFSAFNTSCFKIDSNIDFTAKLFIKTIELWFIAYLVVGVTIFFSAKAWSHNTMLHYGSGVSIGVLASLLILVFILSKILPGRLKNLIYFMFFLSASASVYFINQFANYMSNPITGTLAENWQYIVGYILLSGLISFALVYRYGPVENERTMSLIQWFLQGVGLALVYNSTQLTEVSCALVIILLAVYNFPTVVFTNQRTKNIWFRIFPPKVKLLTEDEYVRQGNESTQAELAKLRDYCRSPDCQAWKVISRLKNPHRFAEFIMQRAWHISGLEINSHDAVYDPPLTVSDTASEAGSDTESELVFVLGNSNMTVRL
ncbi:nuclear envelope integral membrane protein 1-like isoform X2 [Mya arenaria]|uniref:nuclear envelope integral membrane protein 1-like isoform X2 n=1 Tax=Mya arenaria TaxID=6604 RepID=UPI0022E0436D|nr:nuclear envelope integral membrane protein 1-like isoform X2 [Mya arenaria]